MRARILKSLGLNLLAMYGPFLWVFLIDYPWGGYRWHWVKMFPILPGLIPVEFPRAILRLPRGDDAMMMAAAGVVTLVTLQVATLIGSQGTDAAAARRRRWIVAAALLAPCALFSFLSYGLFRA